MNKLSPSQSEQLQEIGTYLKQQRLDKSLTLEQIAVCTMIRLPIVQALEEGDLEQLPELIYVRGFIRRYGEVLGIDGKALTARLIPEETPIISESLADRTTPATPSAYPATSGRSSIPWLKPRLSWLYFLLGGLGIIGGLLYFLTRSPQPKPVVTQPKPSPVVIVKPTPKPSPNLPVSVKVKSEQDTLLKVTIDGKLGYEGTLKSGEEKTWTAQKSIKFRSENAGAIKLSVNNQPQKPFGQLGQAKEITVTPESKPNL